MIDPRRFEKFGVRDSSRSVTSRLYAYPRVAFAMHNKGRDSDGGEDVAHIDLAVHAHQRDYGRWTCTNPLVAGPCLLDDRIGRFARRQIWQASPCTPVFLDLAEKLLQLLLRQDPGREMTVGAVKDKRLRPLRISCCEQNAHRASFGNAEQGGTLAASGVHHCADVVHPFFQRRHRANSVREAGAGLVEKNKSTEGTQAREEAGAGRALPSNFEIGDEARNEDDVE